MTYFIFHHDAILWSSSDAWPNVGDTARVETPFLVHLTQPNSRSTAIAKFPGQVLGIVGLVWLGFDAGGGYEGQCLVLGLSAVDRWWPKKYVNWSSVTETWSQRIEEKKR